MQKRRYRTDLVAPFVGAWIEITTSTSQRKNIKVAPFVGAWIEILVMMPWQRIIQSLRSSERGLKFAIVGLCADSEEVAPFVGAWIEIMRSIPYVCINAPSLRSSERGLK